MGGAGWAAAAGAAAALATAHWRLQAAVPAAYMDEVFHVPQAQRYCAGDFAHWDASITTFPGLYALSAAAHAVARRAGLAVACDAAFLRALNLGLLGLVAAVALQLVRLVHGPQRGGAVTVAHAASVISLPLTLFFSHLYYTDVGSLLCVLATHAAALRAVGPQVCQQQQSLLRRQAPVLLLATCAVAFRQTNVIWVGFSCASAALHSVAAALAAAPAASNASRTVSWKRALVAAAAPALAPAALVGAAFAAFVVHNGGAIVVGDAAAHAPVFHAAQLAYLMAAAGAYAAVDGAVALATYVAAGSLRVDDVHRRWAALLAALVWRSRVPSAARPPAEAAAAAVVPDTRRSPRSRSRSRRRAGSVTAATPSRGQRPQPAAADAAPDVAAPPRLNAPALVSLAAAVAVTAALLHRFSYAHPYLLADNRHYTFYVWRRLLGRSAALRAALAPGYVLAAVLVVTRLLASSPPPAQPPAPRKASGLGARPLRPLARLLLLPPAGLVLLWLACSAAVVVPARLLEPRYFMVPLSLALVHMRHVSAASAGQPQNGACLSLS
jgi:alpha-1,2-glucosyltransferase